MRYRRQFAPVLGLLALLAGSAHAQAKWKLTETLRIGGGDSGPTLFQWTKGIEEDKQGRILVYEQTTQDIRMFGPDGKFIKLIGRRGSGPGELRNAEGILLTPDGKLWVRDAGNTRLMRFSSEGVFEANWPSRFCSSQGTWAPFVSRDGKRIVDSDCIVAAVRPLPRAILAYHTDMSRVDTLHTEPACSDPKLSESATWTTQIRGGTRYQQIPFAPRPQSAFGPDGETWCAMTSAKYQIVRFADSAKSTAVVNGSAAPQPVTAFEKDSVIAALESSGPTGLDFSRIPAVKPAILRLTVDGTGRLWVRRSIANSATVFDVYAPDGRMVATVEMGVVKASIYSPFIVRGDNVYTVVLDSDDIPYVVRYRITR